MEKLRKSVQLVEYIQKKFKNLQEIMRERKNIIKNVILTQ